MSKQLPHSPGPWTIANDDDGWDNIVDAEGALIAEVDSCSGGKDPDARVIAAAPDMLRLLRVLADITLEQARLGIGPKTAIKEARKMLQELDGDT